ncbi:protein kinase domain-containing protein [Colletotrichum tamarilloi]|uniref:Protein kinase domain-containing protein n=1 Tax=Colletotrichum tamarilloi TaxID=1209934 RepID=A0ABQ9QSF1_9PEZI|nr:protein kinase domain-containing protein [Colletotrichum tamarilloi]KAK1483651.1 protein kinase domain-containing protein [Colletotrichum tamarilloi]
MASGASDASLHPFTTVFPGSAPQESAPVAEAQVDEIRGGKDELSVRKTTAGDRASETTYKLVDAYPLDIVPEFELRDKSRACRERFKECLSLLNLAHHDWLEQRSAEFNWWISGLNADKTGPGSLDARLSLRPDVTAVIVDALDGLKDALHAYHDLATSDPHSLTEADADSTASDGVDRAPSPWSCMGSGGGEGPASAVGDGEEKDEEIEDAEYQRKDAHLPLSSDEYAEQRAYIENNLVVLIRIYTAIKLSGLKLRNKRADDALKQAEQEYERQKLTIGAHKALASQDGGHERFRRYLTKLVLRNDYTEDLIRGLSFMIYQSGEAKWDPNVTESRDWEDSQDPECSQYARELNEGQIGESYEVLLQKKLLVVLRAYLCDPARLTIVQRRLIDANVVRRNRLVHAGSASMASPHAPKGLTQPARQIEPLNKSIVQRSSLMAGNVTSSSYNLVSSTASRPVTQSNHGAQATKSFVAQAATALESRFSITGALTPAVRSTARSAGTKIGHVAQDLCGYVCVFEDCESPEDMFASTYAWMSHMARSHSEVEWVCLLCANHRLPADDIQAASFTVPSELRDHILACHPATDANGSLTELELVVSAGQRAVGIRKVRCPLCRPGLVTSEEGIDGSVPSFLPAGREAGLVQLEEDQHIATHIHEFALHAFPSADGEELSEEATWRDSVPSEPSTSVEINLERLRRPESSFQGQAFAYYTIENIQDAIEELNATCLRVQAPDWIQADSSVRLDVMAGRLNDLILSLQLAQGEVDLDDFAWKLNKCQVLFSQLSNLPDSVWEGPQVKELLEELDEEMQQLDSLCETGRQREGQQLSPSPDLPFDRKQLSPNMNPTLTSIGSLQSALRDAEVEIRNQRDAKKYKWIPISSIDEILEGHSIDVEDEVHGFIFKKAKRLFSLLVRQSHFEWLPLFHANDFGDEDFPINFSVDRKSQVWALKSCKTGKAISFEVTDREVNGISRKDYDSLCDFCDYHQWLIFVPIFSPDDRAQVFDPLCRMPFLQEFESHGTNFSIVRHFVIHRSHLNFPRDDQIGTIVDAEDNPHIAVKEILSAQGLTANKFQELANNEATPLARLRDQSHPHLLRVIASYTQDRRHFFVFPWARGGNLRNFWKSQPSLSAVSDDTSTEDWNIYLEWFFKQLLGLASAIKNLHHPRDDPNESCRHGDLKPENILCFSKNEDEIGEGRIPTGVRLVVGDAGHAKAHEMTTEFQGSPTAESRGTVMYSPPEADIKQARTRRYDIWSLGCLYIESLIWMIYGYDALKSFHSDVGPGEPYFFKDSPVDLKDAVKEWIKAIKMDPRCAPVEKTAVGRLVTLIEERMLVVRVTNRGVPARENSDTEHSTAPMLLLRRATADMSEEIPERADAKEVYEEMERIFDAGKQNQGLAWMVRDREASARGPPIITRGLAASDNKRLSRAREFQK